jgi:hypothetical protein
MSRWTFFGRILPERIPLRMLGLEWVSEQEDFGIRYRSKANIADGQFVVVVTIESGQTDVHTLRNLVENDIRCVTDLVGYLHGGSFDVDLVSAVGDDGTGVIFGITIPALTETRKEPVGEIARDLLQFVSGDILARMVLADFREAIRTPVSTGFFCYRAVEAMMQSMKTNPKDKDKGADNRAWELLRRRLQIDRPVIDAIKAHAVDPRHGKVSAISDHERAIVFRLTDEIVRRYLTYLRGGKTELPISEFPRFALPEPKPQ